MKMTAAKPEDPRKINLNLRVSQATKTALEQLSLEDYRSLTNTIELLVMREVEKRAAEKAAAKAAKKNPPR
jgi:hypothetical protein